MTRAPLNAEGVFRGALRLVDSQGLDALTMRALAADMGVATMTLYGHVPTKDDVLLGVVNLVAGEIDLPGPDVPSWDALKRIMREFRRVALQHPNLVPLIVERPPTSAAGLRTLEAALDALRRAGIEPARTAQAYRIASSFAIGFVSLECGGYFRPVDVAAGRRIAAIDRPAVPRIAEVAPYLAHWDADAEFEQGMDVLISVVAGWATSAGPGQMMEGNGRGGGHVQGVDARAHGDPDPAVGRP